jgi:trimeric autotransporter adhesin
LSAALSATTAPATLSLTPTTSTLAAGTYRATVEVGSSLSWVTDSPQRVSITLVVGAGSAPVASVTVSPATVAIVVGGTQQFTATLKDASGNTLTGRAITWSSSNASIVTVHGTTGVATGVAVGGAIITATSEGKPGTSAVTISSTPVVAVTVAPATASIAVGGTQQFAATLKDAAGNTLTGRAITWSTSNAGVAAVNGTTGVATGVAVGAATITATSEGKTGTATITVFRSAILAAGAKVRACK